MKTYGLDRASFNQGKNAKFKFSVLFEEQPTLTARGPGAIATDGRKFMCERLQRSEQSVCAARQVNCRGGADG